MTLKDHITRALKEEQARHRVNNRQIEQCSNITTTLYNVLDRHTAMTLDNVDALAKAFGLEHAGVLITRAVAGERCSSEDPPVAQLAREEFKARVAASLEGK